MPKMAIVVSGYTTNIKPHMIRLQSLEGLALAAEAVVQFNHGAKTSIGETNRAAQSTGSHKPCARGGLRMH
ncbi:hypothetical protein C84B14_13794 [Salinisphaera sp. C84B14]